MIRQIFNHKYVLLILLWIGLTAINLNKAFHIDDSFHLEAAAYLSVNPTSPMSGLINWGNDHPHEHS
ncbi:MAG: hypothetical protein DRJ29_08040 [Bacteroidetes bacterium]|nr:MAG: hypothetical protein DRJ29_08040 [Bacteroidota bacterium]